jgi:hypothetical protein
MRDRKSFQNFARVSHMPPNRLRLSCSALLFLWYSCKTLRFSLQLFLLLMMPTFIQTRWRWFRLIIAVQVLDAHRTHQALPLALWTLRYAFCPFILEYVRNFHSVFIWFVSFIFILGSEALGCRLSGVCHRLACVRLRLGIRGNLLGIIA